MLPAGLAPLIWAGLEPSDDGPEAAEAYTRRLAHTHYENFSVVSMLLPRHLRQDFCNVYAFCRIADDLGDELDDPRRIARASSPASASRPTPPTTAGRATACSPRWARRSAGTRSRSSRSSI